MADRFWVGGTANWDGTAGTKWATSSGGPGGASVPTSADDVYFTSQSTGTCTISAGNTGAKSITCTGFTGTLTGTSAITVSGSVTLGAGMTYSHTGEVTFNGTGTLTTAGKVFTSVRVNGIGITLTLGDALNISFGRLAVTQGTFNTANFSVTAGSLDFSSSSTRTINLGSSTISLISDGTQVNLTGANLTFNAGTSQINVNSINGGTISASNQTFYNVSFTTVSATVHNIFGNNTFNNLSIAPTSVNDMQTLVLGGNQTINGTLTCAGASVFRRVFIRSSQIGIPRTLTVSTLSAVDVDFRDITLAGTASPASPTRAGNCGGNSGINFDPPKTVYRVGIDTTWTGSASWALVSGGLGADTSFPLAQDTAVIDNNTALTGTLNQGNYNFPAVDASTRTTTITLNHNHPVNRYGSYTLGPGVIVTGTDVQGFFGRGTMNLTTAGKTLTFPIEVRTSTGTLRLLDAVTSSHYFSLTSGTFDLNGFTLTVTYFSSLSGESRTIAFGSGSINVTGANTVYDTEYSIGLTITGTPVVNVTSNSSSIQVYPGFLGETSSINLNFTTGTGAAVLHGGVRNLNFTGFSGVLLNQHVVIYGDLLLSNNMTLSGGTLDVTFSSTSSTARNITTNGKTLNFPIIFDGAGGTWRLLDAFTMEVTRTLTHINGTLDLNGFTLSAGASYKVADFYGYPSIKNLTFNGGTLVCPNSGSTSFNNTSPNGFSTTAGTGTGTINMTSAIDKTFVGGGSTYNCTLNNGGAGALTITGSNTFTTLANSVQPTSFLFTAATTTTLTNWNVNGAADSLVTIGSASGLQASHTLSKSSGEVNANYLSISRSIATGGAKWNARSSINGGNNFGWLFSIGNFLFFF